jgi:2-phosphosulfolactate phosphatase
VTALADRQLDVGQTEFAYRFDWGLEGLRALAPAADVVVIVDVLRFSSAVSAVVESGSIVLPYPWNDETAAQQFAIEHDAVLAGMRENGGLSLSPTDLLTMMPSTRLVLPSPNGATLAFAARDSGANHVLAGCLRNASATAAYARGSLHAQSVAVIAAGERWGDGPLRPAVEDLLGAGAVLAALDPSGAVGGPCCSPEARAARAAFADMRPRLFEALCASASGRELIARGWEDDVATSAAHDVTTVVAELIDGAFTAAQ